MGLKGAVIFNSAVDQISKSAKNLQALQDARKKRKQDDEMYDLNKKKAELGLKEMELKGETTSIQNKTQKALMDEYFKQQKTINEGQTAQIDQVEHQQTQIMGQAKSVADALIKTDPTVQSMVAQRINPTITVPGPAGGMITGQDASFDNTPEAVPSSFSNVPDSPLKPSLGANGKFTLKTEKTKDFIAKRIEKLKAAGAPLLPEEQAFDYKKSLEDQGMKYNRGAVLREAKNIAIGEKGDKFVSPKEIMDKISDAETTLYGKSLKDHTGDTGSEDANDKPETTPEQDADAALSKPVGKDGTTTGKIDKYKIDEVRDVPGKGKYKYIGNNKWQKV